MDAGTFQSSRPGGQEPNVSPARKGWVIGQGTENISGALEARHSPAGGEPEMIPRENRVR
jgi:hypothetical protein